MPQSPDQDKPVYIAGHRQLASFKKFQAAGNPKMASVSEGWVENFKFEDESADALLDEYLLKLCADAEDGEREMAKLCDQYDLLNCKPDPYLFQDIECFEVSLEELMGTDIQALEEIGIVSHVQPLEETDIEFTGPIETSTPTPSLCDSEDTTSTISTMADKLVKVFDNKNLTKWETMAKTLDVVGSDYTPQLPQLTEEKYHSRVGPIRGRAERRRHNRNNKILKWMNDNTKFANSLKTGYVYM
jgi:hypothetical protein